MKIQENQILKLLVTLKLLSVQAPDPCKSSLSFFLVGYVEDETEQPVESNEDDTIDADFEDTLKNTATKKTDGEPPSDDSQDAPPATDKKPTAAKDLATLRDKIKVKLRKFMRI